MTALRDLVFEAMDNAVENGYGEMMKTDGLSTVAMDLIGCDSDICEAMDARCDSDELIPHIEAWRAERSEGKK
jgi:hypothetical protein